MATTPPTDLTAETRANMLEKLGWAKRSLDRMSQAAKEDCAQDVQDHFWSLLHATQLIWFYFGRWVKVQGHSKGAAERFVGAWKQTLNPVDHHVWGALNELRNTDVHTKPVSAPMKQTTYELAYRGQPIAYRSVPLGHTSREYVVEFHGENLNVFKVSRRGIELLEVFINEYDRLPLPA